MQFINLQEDGMLKDSQLKKIQKKIGYTFNNPTLLRQAFMRKSYAVKHCKKDGEVLEFFGDRILDFAVMRDFFEQYGRINNKGEFSSAQTVGELCKMDIELVKNAHLAEKIQMLGLTKFIAVGSNSEKYSLKTKADIFEAILDAVAVDSDWNLSKIQSVYHYMMYSHDCIFDEQFCLESEIENPAPQAVLPKNYIDSFETEIWKYHIFKTETAYKKRENGSVCSFMMKVNEKFCKITGFGANDHEAKMKASERGYRILRLICANEIFDDISCVDQLYLLQNCGYLGELDFHYELFPAKSKAEDDVWKCYGSLSESKNEFVAEDASRDGTQETVVGAILLDALGIAETSECDSDEKADSPVGDFSSSGCESLSVVRGEGLLKLILSKYEAAA